MRLVAIGSEAGVHPPALCLIHHFHDAEAVDTSMGVRSALRVLLSN